MPKLTLLLLTLLYAQCSLAQSSVWHIEPDSCVVTEIDEFCDSVITIQLLAELDSPACVYARNRWIGCFTADKHTLSHPITITEDIRLELRSDGGILLAQSTIAFKLLKAQSQRRRIRLPWSVF